MDAGGCLTSFMNFILENNVPDVQLLENEKAIQNVEPYCKGLKAIYSPHTGRYVLCNNMNHSCILFSNNIL